MLTYAGMSMKEIVKMIEYGMKCICAGNDGRCTYADVCYADVC
jgi:hypothetical protein